MASNLSEAAAVERNDAICPPGMHRVFVDAVEAGGRFTAGFSFCEPDREPVEPPKSPSTADEMLEHFPEVVVARVVRLRRERFTEGSLASFRVWVSLVIEQVEKGTATAGQALTVRGWYSVAKEGLPDERSFGTVPIDLAAGQRVILYLYWLGPEPEPIVSIASALKVFESA